MSQNTITPSEQAQFDQFLQQLIELGRSANTLRAYRLDWQQFAVWFTKTNGEPFQLPHLTTLDVQDYLTQGKKAGLKPSTLNRRLGLMKQYVRWGEENGLLSTEQRKRILKIGIIKKQSLAPQSLNSQDVRKLLKAVEFGENLRDRAIIYTLLYTGLRVGELVALTREDLRLSERKGIIVVRAAVAKGGKERQVPVSKIAREALSAYIATVEPSDRLFVGRQGALSEAGVAAIVGKYASSANLNDVSPHVLRHTFAYTYLAQNSNDLVALADILGHSSLTTTQIYTKRRLDDLQAGVEQIHFF